MTPLEQMRDALKLAETARETPGVTWDDPKIRGPERTAMMLAQAAQAEALNRIAIALDKRAN